MGKLYKCFLDDPVVYTCITCKSHLARQSHMIAASFRGRTGRAYLFHNVCNITFGPNEDRLLSTGLHTVCDIYCVDCMCNVGWHYFKAYEEEQKYKEGKFILEKALLKKETRTDYGDDASDDVDEEEEESDEESD